MATARSGARCACGQVLHSTCYELLGSCGSIGCARPVQLLTHQEASAIRLRETAGLLILVGSALALGGACLVSIPLLVGVRHPQVPWVFGAVFLLSGGVVLALAIRRWLAARRTLRLPPPRKRDAPADPKGPGAGGAA